jgi:hypothetical protein
MQRIHMPVNSHSWSPVEYEGIDRRNYWAGRAMMAINLLIKY